MKKAKCDPNKKKKENFLARWVWHGLQYMYFEHNMSDAVYSGLNVEKIKI